MENLLLKASINAKRLANLILCMNICGAHSTMHISGLCGKLRENDYLCIFNMRIKRKLSAEKRQSMHLKERLVGVGKL